MKKILSAVLSLAILSTFAFFAIASGDSEKEEEKTQEAGSAAVAEDNATLGDYQVEIKEARVAKDYEGSPVVIVKYSFTNNSEESAAFMWTFDDQVYQNGVGLEKAYVLADSANYDDSNMYKEIKEGVTLDLEVAYVLNDTETDIEVEVAELISFDDTLVSRTFSIK